MYHSYRLHANILGAYGSRVCEDEELNIILLRLLDYFGHTNPYICAVSYTEVSPQLEFEVHSLTSVACESCSKAFHYRGKFASSFLGIIVDHRCEEYSKPAAHGRTAV